jgi:hypothetical protein
VEQILELDLVRVLVLVGGGLLESVVGAKLDLDLPSWYNVQYSGVSSGRELNL